MSEIKVYLLIGSNLGDRFTLIKDAVKELESVQNVEILRLSSVYETEPWGVKDQNRFLNIAIEIKTTLSSSELLSKCQSVEKKLGRNREKEIRWGERPIDIDIIFYGNEIIETENLKVPHIFMHKRAFVLKPLMDLIPDFVHPVLKKSVKTLYQELEEKEEVFLYNEERVQI